MSRMKHHKGKRYPISVLVRKLEGRKLLIRRGEVHCRVGDMADDGTVDGDSFLVPAQDVYDAKEVPQNALRRPLMHHAGRAYPQTAQIRGKKEWGRVFVVQRGTIDTRVIAIDEKGRGIGPSHVVAAGDVYDLKDARLMGSTVAVDERGSMVIPASFRHRLGIAGRWLVEVAERDGTLIVVPVGPADDRE